MLCMKQWTGQQQTAAITYTHTDRTAQQQQQQQHTHRITSNKMLKALISEIKTHIHAHTCTLAHTHTRAYGTTIICNIEPFYRFPYAVCMCQQTIWIIHTHSHIHSHIHSYAQSISSWFRTFCSYSACLLVPFTADNSPSDGRKRERRSTYVHTKLLLVPLLLLLPVVVVVVASWYFLLFIMHINLNETTEAFVYSCRCYSVHAVDQMNEYVCECTCVCRCRITNVYSDNVIPYR